MTTNDVITLDQINRTFKVINTLIILYYVHMYVQCFHTCINKKFTTIYTYIYYKSKSRLRYDDTERIFKNQVSRCMLYRHNAAIGTD